MYKFFFKFKESENNFNLFCNINSLQIAAIRKEKSKSTKIEKDMVPPILHKFWLTYFVCLILKFNNFAYILKKLLTSTSTGKVAKSSIGPHLSDSSKHGFLTLDDSIVLLSFIDCWQYVQSILRFPFLGVSVFDTTTTI